VVEAAFRGRALNSREAGRRVEEKWVGEIGWGEGGEPPISLSIFMGTLEAKEVEAGSWEIPRFSCRGVLYKSLQERLSGVQDRERAGFGDENG
jgi:hypothetical protein